MTPRKEYQLRLFTTETFRTTVLAVVTGQDGCLSGRQIALRAGLTYRQTIDALNALHNMDKVRRTGRKFTARWSRIQPITHHPAHALEQAFRGFFK